MGTQLSPRTLIAFKMLSIETVEKIQDQLSSGKPVSHIARDLGVKESSVRRVINNPRWSTVIDWVAVDRAIEGTYDLENLTFFEIILMLKGVRELRATNSEWSPGQVKGSIHHGRDWDWIVHTLSRPGFVDSLISSAFPTGIW